jgi:hypothetical protein
VLVTPRLRRVGRVLAIVALALLLVGIAAWRWQGRLIGWAGARYLAHLAAEDEQAGGVGRRREVVTDLHERLLLLPAPDALVPPLFDVASELAPRVASGEMTLAWAGYLYTNWAQDLLARRDAGTPPPSRDEIRTTLEEQIAFFAIRKRPDVPGVRLGDLIGSDDADVLTLEEIERAHEEGRELDLGREAIRR